LMPGSARPSRKDCRDRVAAGARILCSGLIWIALASHNQGTVPWACAQHSTRGAGLQVPRESTDG
jgi:hypothetical protein